MSLQNIKNRLIDRIQASNNEQLLDAIEKLLISIQKEEKLSLSSEQIEMLELSDQDIKYGNIIKVKPTQENCVR